VSRGSVHVVLPDGIDDPARPSGGNVYDRRVCRHLSGLGWDVHEHAVPGSWPRPDAAARTALARLVRGLPDDAVVLLDGLVASTAAEALVPQSGRLRLVVLVHMPLGLHRPEEGAEEAVLTRAAAVVTTSAWARCALLRRYPLRADRLHVAEPGTDSAPVSPGSPSGGALLCVAAVVPGKGHDLLAAALADVSDLGWRCVCVGPLDRDFASLFPPQPRDAGIDDRLRLVGPRAGPSLEAEYATADVLVLASRAETYGMVVTEALAHGLPVVATDVGGAPQALGRAPDGSLPGLLVPAEDPDGLARALRSWLTDAGTRERLRRAARARRGTLTGWATTAAEMARVLARVQHEVSP
jgi:glycosyltransferase involved in cell wall biosynthesis